MPLRTGQLFEFEEFRLDVSEKALLRGGEVVSITPKVFDTLQLLVENAGHLVAKEEILQQIWPERFIEESNLTFNIKMLRKALGDDAAKPRFIETVPRRGYRFIAPVKVLRVGPELVHAPASAHATNGYAPAIAPIHAAEPTLARLSNNGTASDISLASREAASVSGFTRMDRVLLLGFIVCLAVVALALTLLKDSDRTIASRLNGLQIERLSEAGNNAAAAISPDGKLIAYATREAGKPVIWLRQLATGRSLQIMPPSGETIAGISFSRNGEYLYYLHLQEMGFMDASRVSILGGTPTRFLSGIHGGFSFSPDDTRVAYGRIENGTSSIFVANADGSGEQLLTSVPKGSSINSVNWAPDGNSIAFSAGQYPSRGRDSSIRLYDLASGETRGLTEFKWNEIEAMMWLPDQSGLIASGAESAGGIAQMWLIAVPGGEVTQISSSTASLTFRGATADVSRVLALERSLASRVWIGDLADLSAIKDVSVGHFSVALSDSGAVAFPSMDTLTTDIWISNPDGTGRRQLTADKAIESRPNLSPDGKLVAYVVDEQQGSHNVWLTGVDGARSVRLTSGEGEDYPTFTPDGRFVVYNSLADGSVMRVSVEGGEPAVVFKGRAMRPAVSPDGRMFAYVGTKEKARTLFVRSFDGGDLLKDFAIPGLQVYAPKVAWNADGTAIMFAVTDENNVANIFQQRLDGTRPERLTNFTSQRIFDFSVAGGRIALVRGDWSDNTVLLTPRTD